MYARRTSKLDVRIWLIAAVALVTSAQERYRAIEDQPVRGHPYTRYFTTDRFDRRIVFYVSDGPAAPLPLVVYVHGSGAQPNFVLAGWRIRGDNGHSTIADVFRAHARLVIVEKPGVAYLRQPAQSGPADSGSSDFWREHTLERWSEAVSAALNAARSLPFIDPRRTLLLGHSEGGLVASKVAADNPFVTHVATLAGGGPTQLFDLIDLTRAGEFYRHISDEPDIRVKRLLSDWADVLKDPDSSTKQFLGHPYRRWSSFARSSPLQELSRTNAHIYIAQGSDDRAVTPASAEVLYAGLLALGKDVTTDFVKGDHNFSTEENPGLGWSAVMERIRAWFLAPAK